MSRIDCFGVIFSLVAGAGVGVVGYSAQARAGQHLFEHEKPEFPSVSISEKQPSQAFTYTFERKNSFNIAI